ncbi:hypothetical protein F4780DRAFT_44133 [Xylariomycetidae sp. FL0641]|nr:hypothetical protein F4780DRAFT_44133 [Xylariomycetidae sp. FL0641]
MAPESQEKNQKGSQFELQEIDPDKDFPALARCMFDSYDDPPQPFVHVFFPILDKNGDHHKDREAAIAEAADRLKKWHTEDPTSKWHKVIDTKTGNLAGGALWSLYDDEHPFEEHPSDASHFTTASEREFAEEAMKLHAEPRLRCAPPVHVYLFILFTHPDYRRMGAGQKVMDWGIKEADRRGVDFFLDATVHGRPLYAANGMISDRENEIIPKRNDPDEDWKRIAKKVGPFSFWLTWRPVRGEYVEGKTIKPWERKPLRGPKAH